MTPDRPSTTRKPDPLAEEVKAMFAEKAALVDPRRLYDDVFARRTMHTVRVRCGLLPFTPDRDTLIYLNRCQYGYTWRRLGAIYGLTLRQLRRACDRGQRKLGLWLHGITEEEER